MSIERFRHCAGINPRKPQELRLGTAAQKHGESVPWSAEYSKRVFDGEWAEVPGESGWVTAAIDSSDGKVVGAVLVQPPGFVSLDWFPEAPEVGKELGLAFRSIQEGVDHPDKSLSHKGYLDGELATNEGRLRLTHVDYRLVREDGSVEIADWIVGGDCSARKSTTWWDASRTDRTSELTDYEDYGLTSDELWFDYPEFDRYDRLIFRDAPVLEKLGVPAEIRLKPVPAMPPEVEA